MKYTYRQALAWLAFYATLALAPLAVVFVGPRLPRPRSFGLEFGVGLGFVALAMMALQFVLTGRFRRFASGIGLDNMLQFHRQAGMVAAGFLLAHPVVMIAARPGYLRFFDPTVNLPRAIALTAVLGAIGLLLISTLWRKWLGLSYEWWRLVHGLLALFIVFIGLVHVLQVGHYVRGPWRQLVWIGLTGAAMALLLHARIVRPWQRKDRPWRIAEVRPENGPAHTLVVEPDGHDGLDFDAGQFCWLTLGSTPFSLQQHPFTIASSAERPDKLAFTIKALGDFTETVGEVEPGTQAFLEGPFGAFTLDERATEHGAVFVAAGVGITPVVSMLRTFRDRGESPPLQLFYFNRDRETALFLEELRELEATLDLEVIPVLEEPPDGWEGETGRVTPDLLDRRLASDDDGRRYYVCGPGPMMDTVERELVERGIDGRRVLSERFDIV